MLPGSAQRGAGPCGEPGSGPGELGAFLGLLPLTVLSPTQEGRLVEKDSSEWQLQGQPTVLLTLAHIFHRFAPLLVRGRPGGTEAGCGRGACARGWEAEVRTFSTVPWPGLPVTRALGPQGCHREGREASSWGRRGRSEKLEGGVTSQAKGTACGSAEELWSGRPSCVSLRPREGSSLSRGRSSEPKSLSVPWPRPRARAGVP